MSEPHSFGEQEIARLNVALIAMTEAYDNARAHLRKVAPAVVRYIEALDRIERGGRIGYDEEAVLLEVAQAREALVALLVPLNG